MTTLGTGTLPEEVEIRWCAAEEEARFWAVGDVRDVLYSRAGRTRAVPSQATHGLGLVTDGDPSQGGEGIVLRGFAALTPPEPAAGRLLRTSWHPGTLKTPFFLGWSGEPLIAGRFRADSPSFSVNYLFESVFRFLEQEFVSSPLFSLEMVALFRVSQIHDRALHRPVHTGNVLITGEDQAARYFRFHPIRSDLGGVGDPLLALAVTGVGFRPSGAWDNEAEIASSVFYKAPEHGSRDEARTSKVLTHSHALAWRGTGEAIRDLQSALAGTEPGSIEMEMNGILSGLLQAEPSHLVHLDDWSSPLGGLFRAFVPRRKESFQILHP